MSLSPTFIRFASGNVEFYDGNFEHWHSAGHAVQRCDATTGHAIRDVAFCDTHARAAEFVTAMAQRAELLAAAKRVLAHLNLRIDAASADGDPAPVFDGIADLHSAIAKAEGQS